MTLCCAVVGQCDSNRKNLSPTWRKGRCRSGLWNGKFESLPSGCEAHQSTTKTRAPAESAYTRTQHRYAAQRERDGSLSGWVVLTLRDVAPIQKALEWVCTFPTSRLDPRGMNLSYIKAASGLCLCSIIHSTLDTVYSQTDRPYWLAYVSRAAVLFAWPHSFAVGDDMSVLAPFLASSGAPNCSAGHQSNSCVPSKLRQESLQCLYDSKNAISSFASRNNSKHYLQQSGSMMGFMS